MATSNKSPNRSAKADHPSTSVMVLDAINSLDDRRGSSLQAIKKHISNNYDVDMGRFNFLINKFLKSAVKDGDLIQTRGNGGASGSFKLSKAVKDRLAGNEKKKSVKRISKLKTPEKKSTTKSMMKKSSKSSNLKPKTPKKKD